MLYESRALDKIHVLRVNGYLYIGKFHNEKKTHKLFFAVYMELP